MFRSATQSIDKETIMIRSKNTAMALFAVASLSVALATSSTWAADDSGLPKAKPEAGTPKTRAEVKTDRAKAAKDGELNQNANANLMGDKASSAEKKTRAEVKTETAVAKKSDGGTLKTPKN
ncbi:DUF4148 domain-containing protein [Variovorax sp. HJSM1_2]|uniref:DUF4148 domain-containing protein n=1 Tax=Variovorax sp. HJSM1_2 TaxID=3366263 RepID=UPI003BD77CD1